MRIKTFVATSMEKAMNQVRLEMGAEAIILSKQETNAGEVQLTAAVEQQTPAVSKNTGIWAKNWDDDWKTEAPKPAPAEQMQAPATKEAAADGGAALSQAAYSETAELPSAKLEILIKSMAYHGIPTELAEKFCRLALAVESKDAMISLAAALDNRFNYSTRLSAGGQPVMLIGAPGVGKTVTLAKIAAQAKLDGRQLQLVSTDTTRPGALEQLQSYADILEFKLHLAKTPEELSTLLSSGKLDNKAEIMIDTAGVNAYDDEEISNLTRLIVASKAEPVAVIAAGTDTAEMGDIASRFAAIGAKRMIATRLDTTRRYGGLFTAANAAKLSFSYASVSPSVATGLHAITPVNLARLLLRDPSQTGVSNEFIKVAS
ncbi:MAG: hypothetical protein NXI13_04865 [Proteobacteria bacterium]|nr:hypothetical protein [Pseudomonadota bacterium]